jgi:hypothetical protein
VNGLTGARRSARPVRISLCTYLGGDIDGAWWPHTCSVAAELPDLVGALHQRLGEIADIGINWSAGDGAPDLNAVHYGATRVPGWRDRPQRLMVVTGSHAHARLLVVPYMTSAALGVMVLRCAARKPVTAAQRGTKLFETADYVVRSAQVESASWVNPTLPAQA